GQYNKDSSISSFARACFEFALDAKEDLWFSTKDTISKQYDQTFKHIFADIYESEYKTRYEKAGIEYFYTLIDDAVARVIRSEGGFVWACKNYDGDVMSDMVSTAFGSLAMMTSVLVSPSGDYEFEAAHGTITRHYYKYLKGEQTSSNPIATIFAWTGALRKRGEMDKSSALMAFADKLEQACLDTIEDGIMTGDLAALCDRADIKKVNSTDFIAAIRSRLEKAL
ncbi:MAG: NADP-dependent isocitrate dehydrogenase, partial [Oscillospiraceae bacterium]